MSKLENVARTPTEMADELRYRATSRIGRVVELSIGEAFAVASVLAAAEQRGREEVLREVAKLPDPWTSPSWCQVSCDWCDAWVQYNGNEPMPPHPDNGCLWPRAVAAQGKAGE